MEPGQEHRADGRHLEPGHHLRGRHTQLRATVRLPRRGRSRRGRVRPRRRRAAEPDVPAAPAGHRLRRVPVRRIAGHRARCRAGGVIAEKWGWRAAFGIARPSLVCSWRCCSCCSATTARSGCPPARRPRRSSARGSCWPSCCDRAPPSRRTSAARPRSWSCRRCTPGCPATSAATWGCPPARPRPGRHWSIMAGFLGQIVLSAAADRLARRDRRRRLLLPAALSLVSLVLLLAAFAADAAGQPSAARHPGRGIHHHRPVRRDRRGVRRRGAPRAAGHRRVHGRAGAEPARLRRRPARGWRGVPRTA